MRASIFVHILVPRSDDSLELQLYVSLGLLSFLGYFPLRRCEIGHPEAASLVHLAVHQQGEENVGVSLSYNNELQCSSEAYLVCV